MYNYQLGCLFKGIYFVKPKSFELIENVDVFSLRSAAQHLQDYTILFHCTYPICGSFISILLQFKLIHVEPFCISMGGGGGFFVKSLRIHVYQ